MSHRVYSRWTEPSLILDLYTENRQIRLHVVVQTLASSSHTHTHTNAYTYIYRHYTAVILILGRTIRFRVNTHRCFSYTYIRFYFEWVKEVHCVIASLFFVCYLQSRPERCFPFSRDESCALCWRNRKRRRLNSTTIVLSPDNVHIYMYIGTDAFIIWTQNHVALLAPSPGDPTHQPQRTKICADKNNQNNNVESTFSRCYCDGNVFNKKKTHTYKGCGLILSDFFSGALCKMLFFILRFSCTDLGGVFTEHGVGKNIIGRW